MAFTLPPSPEIDHSRRGYLEIAPEVIADLLQLPRDHAAVGVEIGPEGELRLIIDGADMPGTPDMPGRVIALSHVETDDRRLRAWMQWGHRDERWLVRELPLK